MSHVRHRRQIQATVIKAKLTVFQPLFRLLGGLLLHPLPPHSHKDREDDRAQEKPDETEGGETAQHPKRHEQTGNAGSTADHHGTNQVIDPAYHEGARPRAGAPTQARFDL